MLVHVVPLSTGWRMSTWVWQNEYLSMAECPALGSLFYSLSLPLSPLEVRSAAVNSMCQLGIHCPAFATQCVDFLVDMFNDEIQSVRLVWLSVQ